MGHIQDELQLQHLSREGFLRLADFAVERLALRRVVFGRQSPSPGHGVIEIHPAFVFDLPLSGEKHLFRGGDNGVKEDFLHPGDALLSEPLAWKMPLWDRPHELCCFVYREDFVRITYVDIPEALPTGSRPVSSCFYHTRLPPTDSMRRLLRCLAEAGRENDPAGAMPDLTRALLRLTRAMLAADHSPLLGKAQLTFEKIRQYLLENFRSPLTRENVAAQFHLHPGYLSRLFIGQTGRSFGDTLRELRMEHAALLLRNTDLLVDEIADQCGYRSTPFFTAAFRNHHGLPPGKFRCLHFK